MAEYQVPRTSKRFAARERSHDFAVFCAKMWPGIRAKLVDDALQSYLKHHPRLKSETDSDFAGRLKMVAQRTGGCDRDRFDCLRECRYWRQCDGIRKNAFEVYRSVQSEKAIINEVYQGTPEDEAAPLEVPEKKKEIPTVSFTCENPFDVLEEETE